MLLVLLADGTRRKSPSRIIDRLFQNYGSLFGDPCNRLLVVVVVFPFSFPVLHPRLAAGKEWQLDTRRLKAFRGGMGSSQISGLGLGSLT